MSVKNLSIVGHLSNYLVKISDADIEKDDGAAATKQATSMLGSLANEMKNLFGAD